MTGQPRPPKGTYDIVPPSSAAWLTVRDTLSLPPRLSGYGYIETPTFEDTALFQRGVGESTDVVAKQMYTFNDRSGRSLTLRPEGTAGVLRALAGSGLLRGTLPVKVWYCGPNFRYEQPQSGRYRQHTQVGVETVGSEDPALDAEVIWLAVRAYRLLGLTEVRLDLNSLGCSDCRPAYRALLTAFLDGVELDPATRERAALNPMRVLDDKRPEVRAQLVGAPLMIDHLCDSCRAHHDAVQRHLRDLGIPWVDAPTLVRGLDYYTRTTFEFVHEGLGAQSGIGGGGRYDGLMEAIGGPSMPGIGFGLGLDRTMLACEAEGIRPADEAVVSVFCVPIGDEARARLLVLATQLREAGVRADLAYDGRGLKGAMKAAAGSGARLAIIVGDRDLAADSAEVRDLDTGAQESVAWRSVVDTVKEKLR